MSEYRPLAGMTVLVVEDDYLLATDTCEWLKSAGAEVIGPVASAEGGIGLLESSDLNAAIIDINLGRGPAFELATRLAEAAVPFVFATGYEQAVIPEEFHDRPRLEKPFASKQLIAAVRALRQA